MLFVSHLYSMRGCPSLASLEKTRVTRSLLGEHPLIYRKLKELIGTYRCSLYIDFRKNSANY